MLTVLRCQLPRHCCCSHHCTIAFCLRKQASVDMKPQFKSPKRPCPAGATATHLLLACQRHRRHDVVHHLEQLALVSSDAGGQTLQDRQR